MTASGEQPDRLSTAMALLAKAESSSFAGERGALALRAYRELAAYLNGLEPDDSDGRRRERRQLTDRRSAGRRPAGEGAGDEGSEATARAPMDKVRGAYRSPYLDLADGRRVTQPAPVVEIRI